MVSEVTADIVAAAAKEPRWKVWGCLALLLVGLHLAVGPKVRLSEWVISRGANAAMDEALQWKAGSLALSDANPRWEAPEVDGRRYNVVGLAFVLVSLVGTTLTEWAGGAPDTFYPPYFIALVALPLPLAGFWAFRRMVGSSAWAAVLTAYLIVGTGVTSALAVCGRGSLYHINHALAVVGLLVFTADLLGARRVWPALLGLALAVWSRQMTCLYAVPLLWIAWRGVGASPRDVAAAALDRDSAAHPCDKTSRSALREASPSRARRRLWIATAGVVIIAAIPMILNTVKFGNPFDTGYPRMYEGRTDTIGRKAQSCFFGPRYVPEHAWAMNLAFPRFDLRGVCTPHLDPSGVNGAGIWLTSPLLLGVFVTWRRWWSDPCRRALMLASVAVVAGLWCYHTTGSYNAGYYRYALDVIPVWLMVIAPYTTGPRGRMLTVGCLAYSALYFNLLP